MIQKINKYLLQNSSWIILWLERCTHFRCLFWFFIKKSVFSAKVIIKTFNIITSIFAKTGDKTQTAHSISLIRINKVVLSLHQVKSLRYFCNKTIFLISICRAYLTFWPTLFLLRSMLLPKIWNFLTFSSIFTAMIKTYMTCHSQKEFQYFKR